MNIPTIAIAIKTRTKYSILSFQRILLNNLYSPAFSFTLEIISDATSGHYI